MEEQLVAKQALIAFHNNDASSLGKLCSEYVDQRVKYLASDSQNDLEIYLWNSFFDFQTNVNSKDIITSIQLYLNSTLEFDVLFPKENIRYLIPDSETQICILISSLEIKECTKVTQSHLAVVLLKEKNYWRYLNLIGIPYNLPTNSSQLNFRSLEVALYNFNISRKDKEPTSDDQLDIDDYWGESSADENMEFDSHKNIEMPTEQNNLLPSDVNELKNINTSSWHTDTSNSTTKATKILSEKALADKTNIFNLLRSTYSLARSLGISETDFDEMLQAIKKS